MQGQKVSEEGLRSIMTAGLDVKDEAARKETAARLDEIARQLQARAETGPQATVGGEDKKREERESRKREAEQLLAQQAALRQRESAVSEDAIATMYIMVLHERSLKRRLDRDKPKPS